MHLIHWLTSLHSDTRRTMYMLIMLTTLTPHLMLAMENNNALIEACENGDLETVRKSLEVSGYNKHLFRTQLTYNVTPRLTISHSENVNYIHIAAHYGHEHIVAELIKAGAPVDGVDGSGNTPLIYAAQQSHLSVAQCLLSNGADINTNLGKNPPLFAAAFRIKKEMVAFLLSKEANAIALNDEGCNVLYVTMDALTNDDCNRSYCKEELGWCKGDIVDAKIEMDTYTIIEILKKHGAHLKNEAADTYNDDPTGCTLGLASDMHKNFTCCIMAPALNLEHKMHARRCYNTFLLCVQRYKVRMYRDLKVLILSYLPVITKYAQLNHLVVPLHISEDGLMRNFLDDAYHNLPSLCTKDERALMHTLLSKKLVDQETDKSHIPLKFAQNPAVEVILDPTNWTEHTHFTSSLKKIKKKHKKNSPQ